VFQIIESENFWKINYLDYVIQIKGMFRKNRMREEMNRVEKNNKNYALYPTHFARAQLKYRKYYCVS